MVSIYTSSPVAHGSVEKSPVSPSTETRSADAPRPEAAKLEDAAVTSVPARQDRPLRDLNAATALARTIGARLKGLDKDNAILVQANSRNSDVHDLLA